MSTTDPKKKMALSKQFARGYAKILESEPKIDKNILDLLHRLDLYAKKQEPMDLDKFLTYTAFDNIGTAFFSKSFGFLKAVRDLCSHHFYSSTLAYVR